MICFGVVGHEKGSFQGSDSAALGRFELANGGKRGREDIRRGARKEQKEKTQQGRDVLSGPTRVRLGGPTRAGKPLGTELVRGWHSE